MNFPNILTSLRIVVALVAPIFLINGDLWTRIIAGIFIFMAIVTDWLDGWYARKYNEVTKLGKILDPIADKVLIIITFSVFVYLDVLSIWWIIPIFIREILITVYRFLFLSKNIVVAATKSGKIKTVVQMITIGIAYFWFMTHRHYREYHFSFINLALQIALLITLFLTIQSGVIFVKDNWKNIKKFHHFS
jgi:CDP-diacylglycerol--glycerol-3-phosphate 3-phosphatidyltransferase